MARGVGRGAFLAAESNALISLAISGRSLETALHRINRDDIAEQCIFNEKVKSKFLSQKEDLGTSRAGSYDEKDIMKVSESVEDLIRTDVRGRVKADERDEKKYLAEEKEVGEEEEEEKKTVKERTEEIERRLSEVRDRVIF